MDDNPNKPTRMGRMQVLRCKSLPIPPGTKSTVKGGTLFFAEEHEARRRFWVKIGVGSALLAALALGILIGRFLLG